MHSSRSVAMRALIGALGIALAACGDGGRRESAPALRVEGRKVLFPADSKQLEAIATAPVAPAAAGAAQLPGRLVWDEERTVRLYPPFGGRVVKILAKPGDVVKAGQPLAELASPDFGQAQADARKSATDLALAEKNLARVRDLVANDVAAKKDLQNAEADYARARAESARALERVKLYRGGENVDSVLALRSPIAGTVVERNINPGQELRPDAMAGNAPALFVVTDPTRLWVQLDASERDLGAIRPGMTLRVRSSAYPAQTFSARVNAVADFIDPQTRTVKVRGSLANPDRLLKGEMYVTAEFDTTPRPGVAVPAKAVFLSGNHHYVFVQEAPGSFARVQVKTDSENGGTVIVAEGLEVGQKVVIDGVLFLQQILQSKGPA